MATEIELTGATIKKVELKDGLFGIQLECVATNATATREDLDEASFPTFRADVTIRGDKQQLTLQTGGKPKE